jgi:hypothetical protein
LNLKHIGFTQRLSQSPLRRGMRGARPALKTASPTELGQLISRKTDKILKDYKSAFKRMKAWKITPTYILRGLSQRRQFDDTSTWSNPDSSDILPSRSRLRDNINCVDHFQMTIFT